MLDYGWKTEGNLTEAPKAFAKAFQTWGGKLRTHVRHYINRNTVNMKVYFASLAVSWAVGSLGKVKK